MIEAPASSTSLLTRVVENDDAGDAAHPARSRRLPWLLLAAVLAAVIAALLLLGGD